MGHKDQCHLTRGAALCLPAWEGNEDSLCACVCVRVRACMRVHHGVSISLWEFNLYAYSARMSPENTHKLI